MKAFTDYKRFIWLGAVMVVILGFIVVAVVLPSTSDPTEDLGPAVNVPKMENVPPSDQKLGVEVEEK